MQTVTSPATFRYGIDVGGTKIALGLVTPGGKLVAHRAYPTPRGVEAAVILDEICRRLPELLETAGAPLERVEGIGMAFPGDFEAGSGRILTAPNVPSFVGLVLQEALEEAARQTVGYTGAIRVGNDAQAAALAEGRWGSGRGCSSFLFMTVSTGVGGAAYRGGPPVRAVNLEPGLYTFPDSDRPDQCLESLAGGAALARRTKEILHLGACKNGVASLHEWTSLVPSGVSSLPELEKFLEALSAHDLAAAAAGGDVFSQGLLDESADLVASSLAILSRRAYLEGVPFERAIIGGSIALKTAGYLKQLRESFETRLQDLPELLSKPDLIAARLGDERGILGAALFADAS